MIYLDNSSTTYPKPECVYQALDYANRNLAFNAGRGIYESGVKAHAVIDEARQAVASLVNRDKNDVTFVSGATEALNIIINGIGLKDGDCVYISPFEHNSIVRPLYELQKKINFEIIVLPFSKETWEPELEKTKSMMSFKPPRLVAISQVSNVVGLQIDYLSIFDIAKKYNCFTLLDSAQAFGVINPDLRNTDFCVFAGHKSLYASFGVGGFISTINNKLDVVKSGGNGADTMNHFMPDAGPERVESGSQNVVAIASLVESIKWLKENDVLKHEQELANFFIEEVSKLSNVHVYRVGNNERYSGIVSINVDGYLAEEVASILAQDFDICVRAGYHCAPFIHEFIDSTQFKGTVRISFGAFNSHNDITALIDALKGL